MPIVGGLDIHRKQLPECWIPPSHILECRALLETYHDLRAEHTGWVQRIHAVFFHQGAPALGEARCAPAATCRRCVRRPRRTCLRPGSCRWLPLWTCLPGWRPAWTCCGAGCWPPPGA